MESKELCRTCLQRKQKRSSREIQKNVGIWEPMKECSRRCPVGSIANERSSKTRLQNALWIQHEGHLDLMENPFCGGIAGKHSTPQVKWEQSKAVESTDTDNSSVKFATKTERLGCSAKDWAPIPRG
jgi:hypothetical protein